MEKATPRNGLVDIMRLVFAGVVMMYHFYGSGEKHFHGGFLGVEFFVILAGFLFFSTWDQRDVGSYEAEERQHYWLVYLKKGIQDFFGILWLGLRFVFLSYESCTSM